MKARLPQRKTDAQTIVYVRNMMTMIADLALIEEFGFGRTRLRQFHNRLTVIEQHYARAWGDDLHRLVFDLHKVVSMLGVAYGRRGGYSARADLALEHDLILFYIILALHETFGFGAKRLSRITGRMESRIVYQNGVFEGEIHDAEYALRSKLYTYLGGAYRPLEWGTVKLADGRRA